MLKKKYVYLHQLIEFHLQVKKFSMYELYDLIEDLILLKHDYQYEIMIEFQDQMQMYEHENV